MRKIINTFRYGTLYTKKLLIYALIDIIAFAAFGVLAVKTRQMVYFFGSVACVFIFISLLQTMGIHNIDNDVPEEDHAKIISEKIEAKQSLKTANKKAAVKAANNKADAKGNITETDVYNDDFKNKDYDALVSKAKKAKSQKKKTKAGKAKGNGFFSSLKNLFSRSKSSDASEKAAAPKVVKSEKVKVPKTKTEKAKTVKAKPETKKEKEPKVKEAPEVKIVEKEAVSKKEDDETNKNLVVVRQVSDETADTYDKKKIKRTLHKYKVKKDHRLVLVDFSKKYAIKQCPAYIWVADKQFNMLLLEEETRHLAIPLGRIKSVTYLKKQSANADTDYPMLHRNNLLTSLFKPYLPDYTYNTVASDANSHKNLYGIAGGIYFTNRSAKSLFDLLGVDFQVDDKVTTSNKVNIFFKDAYKANILLRDSVIDANGYADSIANTLENMTKSTISYGEFKDTLNLMIKNKLITQEFALYYMGLWDKLKR